MDPTVLIVGAGLAGAKAAEAARASSDGRIVLIGEESHAPYERPPLSKAVLRGEADPNSTAVQPDAEFYREHNIELRSDVTVTDLDLSSRAAQLSDGDAVGFDRLVLATGAEPRRLDIPGARLGGVHYLRTRDDAVELAGAIRGASRVAIVGAGWVGSEVAASARLLGAAVVLIEPAAVPLHRILGEEVGSVFAHLHADHGVELRLGVGVSELQGGNVVEKVVLTDGRVERADVVVVGVGVTPRADLAAAAGLTVDNGVVVDEYLRAGVPGVFAAGDIANAWHPRYRRRLRVEHWANALNQGTAAGANAVGSPAPYTRLPYFYSDQYDLGLEYIGFADAGHDITIRGSLTDREFIAFYHRDGVVDAALTVNMWDVVDDLKLIVESAVPQNLAALSDVGRPLNTARVRVG